MNDKVLRIASRDTYNLYNNSEYWVFMELYARLVLFVNKIGRKTRKITVYFYDIKNQKSSHKGSSFVKAFCLALINVIVVLFSSQITCSGMR